MCSFYRPTVSQPVNCDELFYIRSSINIFNPFYFLFDTDLIVFCHFNNLPLIFILYFLHPFCFCRKAFSLRSITFIYKQLDIFIVLRVSSSFPLLLSHDFIFFFLYKPLNNFVFSASTLLCT